MAGFRKCHDIHFSGSGKRVAESKDGNAVGPVLKLFYRFSDPCLAFGTTCDDGDASTLLI